MCGRLRALDWQTTNHACAGSCDATTGRRPSLSRAPTPRAVTEALEAYFAGELARLDGVDCATGGTPFQRMVWAALREIPPGRTLSYGALAARLGRPGRRPCRRPRQRSQPDRRSSFPATASSARTAR